MSPVAKICAITIDRWAVWFCLVGVLALGPLASGQQPPATAEYQAYVLKHKTVAEVERSLGEILTRLGTTTHLVADARNNQILLRGPDVAQQVARQFIASVDRSTPAQPEAPPSPPVVKAYPCGPMRAAEMADRLRALCPNRDQVRIAPDLDGGQVFVVAPAEIHATIGQQLQSSTAPASREPLATAKPAELPTDTFVPLANVRVEQVVTILQNLVQSRLVRPPPSAGSSVDFVYLDASGRRVELKLDSQRNGLGLVGSASLVAQFARLIQSLDHPTPRAGQALRVISVRKASPAKVEEAIKAYEMGKGVPALNDSSQQDPGHGVGLVNYLFQAADDPAGKTPGAKSAVQSIPATDAKVEQTRRVIRALGNDVEVEVLPDLDVIILRGRDRDVEEVTRIIQELERLSAETQPVVDVYPLKHVGGEALATIITKINESLVGGRQGRVSLTPLVQPNALLMIGWGDAVKATKELLDKLDRPAAPEAEFRVFPLKHAPATATQTVVQGFFAGRTGLSSRVQATADPRTNSLIVQAAPRELDEAARLIEGLDRSDSAAVSQTRIFKLKNSLAVDLAATLQAAIDTSRGGTGTGAAAGKSSSLELVTVDAQGQKLLKSGLLADVRVTADARLNNLLVSCPAESMELMAALIQQLDAPVSSAQIKVFRIVNGDAASLIMMLRSLMVTSTVAGPQLGVAEGESTLAALRFSIDLRTNSIIAVGSPGDLKIVEALLLRLDEQDVQQRKNEVYRLKNAPAMDVATAINEFLRSERQVQQAAPGTVSPFQQIESEVVVVPEIVSNALIISATPRFFEEIHKLVLDLDAQPAQVLIQVLIGQVDLESFNEFGVELGLQDSILYDRGLLGTLASSTVTSSSTGTTSTVKNYTGTPFNDPARVGGSGLSSFSLGNTNADLGFGGLVLSASSQSVSVLLRALEQNHCLEVLSRPQVMTLDNQPAFIQVGQRVPRIVGTAVNSVGSVNSITMENVGLILQVTPRISPEGMVVMEIDAEKSKVGSVDDGIPVSTSNGVTIKSPKIDVTTAQTTVSANSGDTIMLGGLITKEHEVTDRRVPLLADIPILGNLFQYKQNTKNRSELLIILTPHVIRNSEDAERAKQIETARMHWTLADVVQLHGDIGVNCNNPATRAATTIYPDTNPRGTLQKPPAGDHPPAEPEPVPAPLPTPQSSFLPKSSAEPVPRASRTGSGPTLRIVPEGEVSVPTAAPVSIPTDVPILQTVVPTAHFETAPSGVVPATVQPNPGGGSYPSTANLPISSYPQTPY